MLITMTVGSADAPETRFEQRMEIPAHGFLDIPASLDRDGMRECLRMHLAGGPFRSAHARARAFLIPALGIALVRGDRCPTSDAFEIGGTKVEIALTK